MQIPTTASGMLNGDLAEELRANAAGLSNIFHVKHFAQPNYQTNSGSVLILQDQVQIWRSVLTSLNVEITFSCCDWHQ
jgi:hypothetical protein